MPSLADIAGASDKVPIFGLDEPIEVWGLSARSIAALITRYPELRALIGGTTADLTPEVLFRLVPDAIAAVIAAGVRQAGDAKVEADADALTADVQMCLLEAILRLTVGPAGFAPFVERVAAMVGAQPPPPPPAVGNGLLPGKALDTQSQQE